MRWLGVVGDLAFNLLFAALAFASLGQGAWTPFRTPTEMRRVDVVLEQGRSWVVLPHGKKQALKTAALHDALVVVHIPREYEGEVGDLVRLKGQLWRRGAAAYREEVGQ